MTGRTILFISLLLAIAGCNASKPAEQVSVADALPAIVSQPITTQPVSTLVMNGPTEMAKVANGFELKNRQVRVVISEKSGDVIFWGKVGDDRNAVFRQGICTALSSFSDSPSPDGYIEKRDDQTWQFFGTDSHKTTWRKIYCLEHESLLVSILATNGTDQPITTSIEIRGDFPNLRITQHTAEQFSGNGAIGPISIHAFNENRNPAVAPKLPILVQSDSYTIKPGERISLTSEWKLADSSSY